MTGIVACSDCVYLGGSAKNSTKVCRRRAPATPMQNSTGFDYVPASWPAVDPEKDGCGDGET